MPWPDLITLDRALAELENPTPSDLAALPTFITSASNAIRGYTRQVLTYGSFDEFYSTRQYGRLVLRQKPIIGPVTVRTHPRPVLTITNTNTNYQQAFASLIQTGDPYLLWTSTGILLSANSMGSAVSPLTFLWTTYPTFGQLAAAINGAGNGWSASIQDGFGNWATSDLHAPHGNQFGGSANVAAGARFFLHTHYVNGYVQDPESAILDFQITWSRDIYWPFFFPETSELIYEGTPYAVGVDCYRVQYNAGYWAATQASAAGYPGVDLLPPDLEDATALTVKWMLYKKKTNPMFMQRSLNDFSYVLNPDMAKQFIPDDAKQILDRSYFDPFQYLDR
jgi:hypothetical protein